MKLPRLTTRRLMVLVAVLALPAWVAEMVRRCDHCRTRAAMLAYLEAESRERSVIAVKGAAFAAKRSAELAPEGLSAPWTRLETWWHRQAEHQRSRASDYARLRREFQHAASRPWLLVGPDPPWPPLEPDFPSPDAAPLSWEMANELERSPARPE